MSKTLVEKIWDAHVVKREEGFPDIIYNDTHLIHEVTSPQLLMAYVKEESQFFAQNKR